jgi:hypothetical protein
MPTTLEPKQVENMLKYCVAKLKELEALVGKSHRLYQEINGEYETISSMIGPSGTYKPDDRQWGLFTERLLALFSGPARIETQVAAIKAEQQKEKEKKAKEDAARKALEEAAKKKAADEAAKKAKEAEAREKEDEAGETIDWLKKFPWETGPALVELRRIMKQYAYKMQKAIDYVKKSVAEAEKSADKEIDGLEHKQWKRMLDGLVKVKPLVEKNRKDGDEPLFDGKPLWPS